MKTYISKPYFVKVSEIFKKDYILAPSRYNFVAIKNNNTFLLKDIVSLSNSSLNLNSNKWYYTYIEIWDINNSTWWINYKKVLSNNISSSSISKLNKYDILVSTVRTYLWWIWMNLQEDSYSTKALIVLRKMLIDKDKFYLYWLLRSKFFIEQASLLLNSWVYPRLDRASFDLLKIPFPSKNNHKEPEKIEKLVSLIVQNLIDKEEQIKRKNILIDEMIERELRENQREKEVEYSFPRISEIFKEWRLDTMIYWSKYNNLYKIIKNYNNWFYFLGKNKISPWVTPKDYHFSDFKKNNNYYDWITPKNINNRELTFKTYIHTKSKSKVKKYSLIMSWIRYVWNGIFLDDNQNIFCNQNTLIINQFEEKIKQLFLFCFLTSRIGKSMQTSRRNFWIVPILYTESLCKIPIPNFPNQKQEEIAREYYNNVEKIVRNENFRSLQNYLQTEKERNKQLWIFQLNMEIFSLREELENIIDKIIMDEKIEIEFGY